MLRTQLLRRSHADSLSTDEDQKKRFVHDVTDTDATHVGLVPDVTDTDCQKQIGSTHDRIFASFPFLASQIINLLKTNKQTKQM